MLLRRADLFFGLLAEASPMLVLFFAVLRLNVILAAALPPVLALAMAHSSVCELVIFNLTPVDQPPILARRSSNLANRSSPQRLVMRLASCSSCWMFFSVYSLMDSLSMLSMMRVSQGRLSKKISA